jgi:endonuclease YncB( thermonuclease family)
LLNVISTLAALALIAAVPAAATGCEGLVGGPRGTVTAVRDGDTVLLDSGLVVRLIGIQAPKLPLGREDFPAWPLAETARAALETLTLNQKVEVRYGGERVDRYGRTLGQLYLTGETPEWVQQALVAQGLARVYSFPDNRACVDELLGAETVARVNRLGIWADPYYSVRRADRPQALLERAGRYELVEGRVLKAERVGSLVYLNFGRVWKEDFTVVIDSAGQKRFGALDPLRLEGALVRVRGWVESNDGPRIGVTHPEQVEVLSTR